MQNVQRAERAAANPPRPTAGTTIFVDTGIEEVFTWGDVSIIVLFAHTQKCFC